MSWLVVLSPKMSLVTIRECLHDNCTTLSVFYIFAGVTFFACDLIWVIKVVHSLFVVGRDSLGVNECVAHTHLLVFIGSIKAGKSA